MMTCMESGLIGVLGEKYAAFPPTPLPWELRGCLASIGSLRNDDDNGNDNATNQ